MRISKTQLAKRWVEFRQVLQTNELLVAVLIAAAFVIVGIALGYENNKLIPANPATTAHYIGEPGNKLSFLSNWDGPIYLSIAQHGYSSSSITNFFPLYPLLTHIVTAIVPSVLISGLLVAWAGMVGAFYFYLRIVKHLFHLTNMNEMLRAASFFILFPTSVFLMATYTESLFAFLALGGVYYALKKQWLRASIFIALATLTHANGVFVALFVAAILYEQKERLKNIVTGFFTGCLGLFSYMIYLQLTFHNLFAFVDAQKNHSWVHGGFEILSNLMTRNGVFYGMTLLAVWYWWNRRRSFALYSFLYLCLVVLTRSGLSGTGRYTLMVFPVQLMAYDYSRNRKPIFTALLIATSICWTYFLLQYMAGYTGG